MHMCQSCLPISVFSWFCLCGNIYICMHTEWMLVLWPKGHFSVPLFSSLLISAHSKCRTVSCSVICMRLILLGTGDWRAALSQWIKSLFMKGAYTSMRRSLSSVKQSNSISHPLRVGLTSFFTWELILEPFVFCLSWSLNSVRALITFDFLYIQ